jgi:hypothetical protein
VLFVSSSIAVVLVFVDKTVLLTINNLEFPSTNGLVPIYRNRSIFVMVNLILGTKDYNGSSNRRTWSVYVHGGVTYCSIKKSSGVVPVR